MRKFHIKAKIKLLIFAFASIGIIMIAGNISLAVNQDTINQGASRYFEDDISVGPVFYVFPNIIILKNVMIKNKNLSTGVSLLYFPNISASFSIRDFLFKGALYFSDVTIDSSKVSYYALSQFLEDNIQEILEIIKKSSGQDMKVKLNETLLDFDRKGVPDYIATELLLTIKEGSIEGIGYFRADQYQKMEKDNGEIQRIARGWPLWYKWQGELKSDGISFDHLIFKSENMYSKLWGSARSGLMKVNGFMFVDTTKQNSAQTDISLRRYFKDFSEDNKMPHIDMYVFDIDGRMHFAFPNIEIDQFNFTLNNTLITSKGSVSLLDPPTLSAHLSLRSNKDALYEKTDISLTSVWKDKVLSSEGQVNIKFAEHGDLGFSPENGQISFTDLRYYFDQERRATVDLAGGEIAYWINSDEHRVAIHNFKSVTNTRSEGKKVVDLNAKLYNGSLSGEILFDSTQVPSKVTSHVELKDVDTNALEDLLVQFAKFNGRMTSTIEFTNVPQLGLSGYIVINDGQMTDFDFFNWVADSFRLPELQSIDFKKATAQFLVNKEYIQIRDIHLNTEDVEISGYYGIDHQNLVSSEITLALSKELLGGSPKFKPVLKMFDDDALDLDFDFRLSGNAGSVNFQWVPSDVKKKIQTRIPDFIERKIERNVDSLMEPDPAQ